MLNPIRTALSKIKTFSSIQTIAYTIVCLTLLIIGLYLRLRGLPGEMFFSGDQGQDFLVALRIVQGEFYPLVGPILNVRKFFTPPTYYYILAGLFVIFKSEVGIVYFFVLLNILSGILFTIYIKRKIDDQTATLFFAFYMVTYFSVIQTHSIWQPFPVAFCVSLSILLMSDLRNTFSYWKTFFAIILFTIGLTTYFSTILLIPLFLNHLYTALKNKLTDKLALTATYISFGCVAVVFHIPWIISEINNNFPTLNSILKPSLYQIGNSSHFVIFDTIPGIIKRIIDNIGILYRIVNPQVWRPEVQTKVDLIFLITSALLILEVKSKPDLLKKFNNVTSSIGYKYLILGLLPIIFFESQAMWHRLIVLLPFLIMIMAYTIRITLTDSNIFIKMLSTLLGINILMGGLSLTVPYYTDHSIQTYSDVTSLYSFLTTDIASRNTEVDEHDFRVFTSDQPNYYDSQPLWYLLKKHHNYPIEFAYYGNDTPRPQEASEIYKYTYLICFPNTSSFNDEACQKLFMPYYSDGTIIKHTKLDPYSIYLVKSNERN